MKLHSGGADTLMITCKVSADILSIMSTSLNIRIAMQLHALSEGFKKMIFNCFNFFLSSLGDVSNKLICENVLSIHIQYVTFMELSFN